jgi:DNA-binding HxlR family transcriptional regulator
MIRGVTIFSMARLPRHSTQLCQRLQIALDLLAKRWNGLIVGALLEGPLRYSQLSAKVEVIGDRMLSERLKELEEHGIVERRVITRPVIRAEYALTKKGRAFGRVLGAMSRWADEWVDLPSLPSAARRG